MASNSFTLKGWSVAAVTALLAFAAGTRHQWLALVALLPTIVFWILDGYYLALEQRFRALFSDAAGVPPPHGTGCGCSVAAYDMDSRRYASKYTWRGAALSRSVWPVHGVAALTVALVACVLWMLPDKKDDPARVKVVETETVQVAPDAPAAAGAAARPGPASVAGPGE